MPSHSSVAKSVREHKEQHPELYCAVAKCLWRIKTARGDSPCRNHQIQPAPVAPSAPTRTCNRCNRVVGMRVEVFTSSQRLVVCAGCAADLASTNPEARIVAHQPPPISYFVAADGFYTPNPVAVTAHQRELDAEAERFAERVRGHVARQQSVVAERSVEDARASILGRMSPGMRATFQRRGIA